METGYNGREGQDRPRIESLSNNAAIRNDEPGRPFSFGRSATKSERKEVRVLEDKSKTHGRAGNCLHSLSGFPGDRSGNLIAEHFVTIRQGVAWKWVPVGILDLDSDTARCGGRVVDLHPVALEEDRFRDEFPTPQPSLHRNEPVDTK